MNRITAVLASLAFCTSLASAQNVTFAGKVENGEGVCYYCPGFDFVLDFTHTSLSSPTIPLLPFVGQYVTGAGVWNGSTISPKITVSSIQLTPQSFSIGGNASIGGVIKFTTFGTPGDTAIVLLSATDGFSPVTGYGTLFLGLNSVFVLGQGTIGGAGDNEIKVDLPNEPALVGLKVFGQSVRIGAGTHSLTNSDLKIIS